jgi:AraC-like DNA-binding protein
MVPSSSTRQVLVDTQTRYTITRSSFSTRELSADAQILAWRQRVGHVVDVPPSAAQLRDGFGANIDAYVVGKIKLTDARTDAMTLDRSLARVSTDALTDYAFHLFIEGDAGIVTRTRQKPGAADGDKSIIAFDLTQPFHVERPACRVLTLFLPRDVVDAGLPDGESIHGRTLSTSTPLGQLVQSHIAAIGQELPTAGATDAVEKMHAGAELILAGFRKVSHLNGVNRAAVQTVVMGQVRRFIEANLHDSDLTPTYVVDALKLKRATIYRWFEHEGGLGAYIRQRRLRMAATELVRFPQLPVIDIAYGLGFKSASDFTRAFRRAFDTSPKDFRLQTLGLRQIGSSANQLG